jgi:hypothetical protein
MAESAFAISKNYRNNPFRKKARQVRSRWSYIQYKF